MPQVLDNISSKQMLSSIENEPGLFYDQDHRGQRESERAMTRSSEYRKHAEECTKLALTARTQAQRTMLLHIADTWLRLAKDADSFAEAAHAGPLNETRQLM
jgi:hypothetical protein